LNRAKLEESYEDSVFGDLVSRFEEPNDNNRWDAPLFTILHDDTLVPCDAIWDAVMVKKPRPPNLSTVVKPVSETNYLYELEKTTQDIVNAILEERKHNVDTGIVKIPRVEQAINLPSRAVTLAELRRLRRQFTNINKMHTLLDMDRVADLFVDYLNTNMNR